MWNKLDDFQIVMDPYQGSQIDLDDTTQLSCSSDEELDNLLSRYKYGMTGNEMVTGATRKKCSPSIAARKMQNEKRMQKKKELEQQSLDQIWTLKMSTKHNGYRENKPKGLSAYLTLSKQLKNSVVTLPESGGYRQYVLSKESKSNRRRYYRCTNCHKLKSKTGYGPIANIHVQDGVVIRGKSSAHHPDCKALSETDIIAMQMDRQSRREILEGKDPYDAYRKNFEKAMELAATFDESNSNSKKFNIATAYPSWHSVCKKYKRLRHDRSPRKGSFTGVNDEQVTNKRKKDSIDFIRAAQRLVFRFDFCLANEEFLSPAQREIKAEKTITITYRNTDDDDDEEDITDHFAPA
ncbi:unnamed protein product [Anisakis simplex]|uniref:FLYWCH-type domain-containing protein n=1 Tax=Anisakis simplex TaxID=6269 RepID=A0A0M3JZ26_ANISI|nr:unnamed protein product [Anisakis simplex]